MAKSRLTGLFLRAVLTLIISLPFIFLLLSLRSNPTVQVAEPLNSDELAQVEQILLEATPGSPTSRSQHELRLDNSELNLLLRYGVEILNLRPAWAAHTELGDNALISQLSVQLLATRLPLYLNIDSVFTVQDKQLQLQSMRIGRLSLPRPFLDFAMDQLQHNLSEADSSFRDIRELLANIEEVSLDSGGMNVQIVWDPVLANRLLQQARMLFVSAADQQRIMHYYEQIGLLALTIPNDIGAVSLNTFLVPLFQSALERSRAGADPVAENRTLLQSLAIYVNDANIEQLLGAELAAELPPARFVEVRLHRRQDLAQHLVSIAAISASAGAGFAQTLSNTKEAYDARYRSGFSFSDLAANSVGVRLATYATHDPLSAMLIQERLASLNEETDYMPSIGSNRDGISESDFTAIYQDRSSPEYQARMEEIEELIANRPLFQDLPELDDI